MNAPVKRFGALALVGLVLLVSQADAQRVLYPPSNALRPQIYSYPVNPNQFIAPNLTARQAAFNMGVIGRGLSQIPPWAFGYNPYPSPIYSPGPVLPQVGGVNPYGLSTVPNFNPYGGTGFGGLATDPYGAGGYSLSTSPYGNYGSGYGSPYGGYGYPDGPGANLGLALQGVASVTAAQGRYWQDIGQARITRQQANQMALDTARKRIQMEAWYESMKPTAGQKRDREMATDLDRARKDASGTDISSAQALNHLLRSIKAQGERRIRSGPPIKLSKATLENITLSDRSSTANVGLLKTALKSRTALQNVWPESLKGPAYEDFQKRLVKKIHSAAALLEDGEPVEPATLSDIRNDFQSLSNKVNDTADEMSPAQYIEAKRFLNQLGSAVKAMGDPKAVNYFRDRSWTPRGDSVSALVEHMLKEGLSFAPATTGTEGAYTALYYALREFEAGLQGSGSGGSGGSGDR